MQKGLQKKKTSTKKTKDNKAVISLSKIHLSYSPTLYVWGDPFKCLHSIFKRVLNFFGFKFDDTCCPTYIDGEGGGVKSLQSYSKNDKKKYW